MSLIRDLVEHFGLSTTDIMRVIKTAPARYKVYSIPKRTGGVRIIAQPSRELKDIQRFLLHQKLSVFPVHPAAAAYVKEQGIGHNAARHRHGNVILKLDFRNFFPSILTRDWANLCRRHPVEGIEIADLTLYSKILFWGGIPRSITPQFLSIGAPTSPFLSNILMYEIDEKLSAEAERSGVVYTRYADDITVSGPDDDTVLAFERFVRQTIRSTRNPRLVFNDDKRGLYRKGQRRMVTGLVITPTEQVSIGRARKREIASLLHRSSLRQLDEERRGYLKGMLGFCIATEPNFITRMRRKYGNAVVDAALAFYVPVRRRGTD
jgi:hypothetical protein